MLSFAIMGDFLDGPVLAFGTVCCRPGNGPNIAASNSPSLVMATQTRKPQKKALQETRKQHNSTKTTQNAFGICGRIVKRINCKRGRNTFFSTNERVAIASTKTRSPLYARIGGKLIDNKFSLFLPNSTDETCRILCLSCHKVPMFASMEHVFGES